MYVPTTKGAADQRKLSMSVRFRFIFRVFLYWMIPLSWFSVSEVDVWLAKSCVNKFFKCTDASPTKCLAPSFDPTNLQVVWHYTLLTFTFCCSSTEPARASDNWAEMARKMSKLAKPSNQKSKSMKYVAKPLYSHWIFNLVSDFTLEETTIESWRWQRGSIRGLAGSSLVIHKRLGSSNYVLNYILKLRNR